jgi:hypothetical protein
MLGFQRIDLIAVAVNDQVNDHAHDYVKTLPRSMTLVGASVVL